MLAVLSRLFFSFPPSYIHTVLFLSSLFTINEDEQPKEGGGKRVD